MRTMLVPCCMRLKCLPRTPLLKSREGRGARGSRSLAFFILFNLGCGRETGSNETDSGFGFSVNDEEDAVLSGHSDGDEASSSSECWSSGNVEANGSSNTVIASAKETLCFLRLLAALAGSNSNIWRRYVMRLFYDDIVQI